MRTKTTHYVLSWILAVAMMLSAISPTTYTLLAQTGEEGSGGPVQAAMTALRDTAEEPELPETPEGPEQPQSPAKPPRSEKPARQERDERTRDSGAARMSVPFGAGIGVLSIRAPKDQTRLYIDSGVPASPVAIDGMFEIKIGVDGQPPRPIDEIDELDLTKPLTVKLAFKVPVMGDYTPPESADLDEVILKDDWATFVLGEGFTLAHSTPPQTLRFDGEDVATTTVENNASGDATVHLDFDGDEIVFNGDRYEVECEFNAELLYIGDAERDEDDNITVVLLGKTYTFTQPKIPTEYTAVKSGVANLDSGTITWTVDFTGQKGDAHISLKDLVFSDDLTAVGDYVAYSFKTGTTGGTLAAPVSGPDWNDGTKLLAYTFGDVQSPQTISFETEMKDANYYANSEQTVKNTARLLDSGEPLTTSNTAEAKFTPKWIEKEGNSSDEGSGGVYDPINRTITWTIQANHMDAHLNGVVITDAMQDNLTFVSGVWQAWDAAANDWSATTTPLTHVDNKFSIGTITTRILLTIVTRVPDPASGVPVTGETHYKNSASITWAGGPPGPGIGTGNITVGVGYNAITKSGTRQGLTRDIEWTVNVYPKGQNIPNLKVYDLLVYGKASDVTLIDADLPGTLSLSDITARYGQEYITDSFAMVPGTAAGALTVHPIEKGGKRVADLLEIHTLDSGDPSTFKFQTRVNDPAIFAGNGSGSNAVRNTAALYSGTAKLNAATANVSYANALLRKEMLKRGADPATATGANNLTKDTEATEGFNYTDNSAVFRLVVNADSVDFTDSGPANGVVGGDVIVTDTLPEGWVFTSLTDDPDGPSYYIYAASRSGTNANANATADAFGEPLAPPPASVAFGTTDDGKKQTATFTFKNLKQPYVILVKGSPTDAKLKEYFEENKSATSETNTVALENEAWELGTSKTRDVSIKSQVLGKEVAAPSPRDGTLTWTVNYTPHGVAVGDKIIDTLSPGLTLRTDGSGNLDLDSITIYEQSLNADGEYTLGDALTLTQGGPAVREYDAEAGREKLVFTLPKANQAYRLVYITDVIGDPDQTVSNEVALTGHDGFKTDSKKTYTVSETDASATMRRSGSLTIAKRDADNGPLSGAVFSMYADDKSTLLYNITVNNSAVVRGIRPGSYWLKETKAPDGHMLSEERWYRIEVSEDGQTTTINGVDSTDLGVLSITNYATSDTRKTLTLEKRVTSDDPADYEREFEFIVAFSGPGDAFDYDRCKLDGSFVEAGTAEHGGIIRLKADEYAVIYDLPVDLVYRITENAVYNGVNLGEIDDYITLVDGVPSGTRVGSGTLEAGGDSPTVTFENIRLSALIIQKTVELGPNADGAIDSEQKFTFTLRLTDSALGVDPTTLEYDCFITEIGGSLPSTPADRVSDGDTITLKHGQQATIVGLPQGIHYEVVEADYQKLGYESAYDSGPGYKAPAGSIAGDQTVRFINTQFWYDLIVEKQVENALGNIEIDTEKAFEFTLTLDEDEVGLGAETGYPFYLRDSGGAGWVRNGNIGQNGGTFTLRHDQQARVTGLPKGIDYKVSEKSYNDEGYSYAVDAGADAEEGIMDGGRTVRFINTQWLDGQLVIQKNVTGNAASTSKPFEFTVTFTGPGADRSYEYTGKNGAPSGAIASGDTILLAHGQSIAVEGLPVGLRYKVGEKSYAGEGYTATSAGEEGVISQDEASVVTFTNRKHHRPHSGDPSSPGGGSASSRETGLTVQKTVTGEEARRDQAFTFVVTFDADGEYRYTGSKSGTLSSGDRITLAHGESIRILGLPTGANYQITELEAHQDGYYSTNTGASGRITASGQTAAFINAKGVPFIPPNTGDDTANLPAILALLASTILLGALVRADYLLRRKHPKSEGAA